MQARALPVPRLSGQDLAPVQLDHSDVGGPQNAQALHKELGFRGWVGGHLKSTPVLVSKLPVHQHWGRRRSANAAQEKPFPWRPCTWGLCRLEASRQAQI